MKLFSFKKKERLLSVVETIEAIHNEFDSATERLLAEAKTIIEKPITDKGERMAKIGFGSTAEAKEALVIKSEKQAAANLAHRIMDYSVRYPNNKFITEQEVKKICEKYSLVFGESKDYIGDIPDENLLEIEAFALKEEDKFKSRIGWYRAHYGFGRQTLWVRGVEGGEDCYYGALTVNNEFKRYPKSEEGFHSESPAFKICASVKDFDMTGRELQGYKVKESIPDPIVLQPVSDGYLIVSKWGLEASDPIAVNQSHN